MDSPLPSYTAWCGPLRLLCRLEIRIQESARELVPRSRLASDAEATESALEELERVLQHHLAKSQLAHVWSVKQTMLQRLDGKTGDITERLRSFVTHTLGNPEVSQSELQRSWSELIQELSRIHGLRSYFETVADVPVELHYPGHHSGPKH